MGFVKNYKDAVELPLSDKLQAEIDQGAALLRKTMASYGVSKEAAEAISFKINAYTLTIGQEEAWSGAGHQFANGKPFYEISITAPGSMFDIATNGQPLPQQTPQQQTALLAFEISMNLVSRIESVIELKYGGTADRRAGGVSSAVGPIDFSTSTAREPALFFAALNDLLDMRLGMLTPKLETAPEAKPARAPKPPGL